MQTGQKASRVERGRRQTDRSIDIKPDEMD